MEQIINIQEHSAFILFMVIVLIVWIISRYEPKMSLKIAELDLLQQVQRLEADFENCRNLEQLDRLEKFIDTISDNAKKVVSNPKVFSERRDRAYENKHGDRINDTHPGIEQYLIPFLTIR